MKNATITLLLALLTVVSYSQDSLPAFKIKDYSLRDYVAPDIKYNRLTAGTDLNGGGIEGGGNLNNSFNGAVNMSLYTYRNSPNFQGSGYTDFSLGFSGYINGNKSNTFANSTPRIGLNHNSTNRWYNSNNRFLGVHPNITSGFYNSNTISKIDNVQHNSSRRIENVKASVILSVGMGRIQPVTAARRAMDILISLEKYNRLAKSPSSAQVDSLAKIANTIAFKRFYDRRYKRIYQLEELDKGIQGMGLVDNLDMVYAANLSDIWGYGITYSRGSGSRFEFGVIPLVGYSHYKSVNDTETNEQILSNYSITGIASWVKQTPLNYKWQSDFSVNLNFAISGNDSLNYATSNTEISENGYSQLLGLRWTAGYFPNTRTHVEIGPFVNLTASQITEKYNSNSPSSTNLLGVATGLGFKSYYYISPRFRLSLEASAAFISGNYQNVNSDSRLGQGASPLSQHINSNLSGLGIFQHNYLLNISYAIF